jgi:VanZ family protein
MNDLRSRADEPGLKKFIPGIAWFFLVLVLICLPGEDIPSVNDWLSRIYFDKWVHTGLFAVLTFLFMFPYLRSALSKQQKWQYCLKIMMAACIWGLATEFIQKFFITGRSFDLFDWSADCLGALIAGLFAKMRFVR